MTAKPKILLTPLENVTLFAPLVALGYWVREQDLLSPVFSRLQFSQPTHIEKPEQALLDLWVSILAGCRSVSQVNTLIRPDRILAQAWGRDVFYEQSSLARVLDVCQVEQVAQLRVGVEKVYGWIGQAPQHNTAAETLLVDIDLTGLLASKRAEGSTKGYFSQKKGPLVGRSVGLA